MKNRKDNKEYLIDSITIDSDGTSEINLLVKNGNRYDRFFQKLETEKLEDVVSKSTIKPITAMLNKFEHYRAVMNEPDEETSVLVDILPPLPPVLATDGMVILDGRCVGNTTRIVDNIVQLLFNQNIVVLCDVNADEECDHLLISVRHRINFEHNQYKVHDRLESEGRRLVWLVSSEKGSLIK